MTFQGRGSEKKKEVYFLSYFIVGSVIVLISVLAVRSLWKSHKSGGDCNGDFGNCRGCH